MLRADRRVTVLFLFAVLCTVISGCYFIRFLLKPEIGLVADSPEITVRDGGIVFASKSPFSPAVSAGLLPMRDTIVRVGDKDINNSRDIVRAEYEKWTFDPVVVEVIRDGKDRLTITIHPAFILTRIDWFLILLFFLILVLVSFDLIFRHGFQKFSVFTVLAFLMYMVYTCVTPFFYENLISNTLVHLGSIAPWLILFSGLFFPKPRGSAGWRNMIILVVLLLCAGFLITRLFYFQNWNITGNENYLEKFRNLGKFRRASDAVAYVTYIALLFSSFAKTGDSEEKRRLEWIIAGFIISVLPFFFLNQLPVILNKYIGFQLGVGNLANVFLLAYPLFLAVGMVGKRLFDLKTFLSRHGVYFFLALLIVFFFTVLYFPLVEIVLRHYRINREIAGFLVTICLVILLFPLRSSLVRIIERVFYRRHFRRTPAYTNQLETENRKLYLMLEELNRSNSTLLQTDHYQDLKGIIRGIIDRLKSPSNHIRSELSDFALHLDRGGKESDNPEINGIINRILIQNREIRDFLSQLEDLARLDTPIPVKVDIAFLVRNAASQFEAIHPETSVGYGRWESMYVHVSPQDVIESIVHLMINASEAMAKNIQIDVYRGGNRCRIEICDNGSGVALNRGKLFSPFYTTKSGRNGLGLYLARLRIERNQGTIHLRRKKGTRVRLVFPVDTDRV